MAKIQRRWSVGGARALVLALAALASPTPRGRSPRQHQVDLRFGKLLTVGSTRIRPRLDIFNLFNASSPQTYRSTVLTNVNYGRIGSVLSPRFVKLGASVDF